MSSETLDRISHYKLVARLGKGAMGEVYRAIDERLGRAVALKLLPRSRAESVDMQARLLREAQAASALNHPGIVTVHDIGAWHGRIFMVMELVDGERLSDLARNHVATEEALRLVAEAADALGAAHARDILHRDVKSDNLMRAQDGRLKVLDFGLAKLRTPQPGQPVDISVSTSPFPKVADGAALAETLVTPPTEGSAASPLAQALESTETEFASQPSSGLTPSSDLTLAGQLVGTPAYMAPEQTQGGSSDAQSEVFSLGVVLYELLVGRRPFDRPSIGDTLEAVRSAEILPPSALAPERNLPASVDAVVMRALDRDRARRFPDMATFAVALRKARLRAIPEDPRRSRRRTLIYAALAFGLTAIATTTALVVSRPERALALVHSTRRITFDLGCEEYPSFAPDGKSLVYDGLIDGDYELLALDLPSGDHRRLTHEVGWDWGGALSPDGKWIAFVHATDAGRELRLMPAAGDQSPVTSLGLTTSFPVWSADNAIVASTAGDRIARWQLSAGSAPQSTELAVLPHGGILRYASVYRDGEIVAMWQPSSQETEFLLGTISTGGEARILDRGLPVDQVGLFVAPSQDGFYYARHGGNANELLRHPRNGGSPLVVPGGISASSGFSISADGKRLAYSTCRETMSIARLRPGAPPVDLMPRGLGRDRYPVAIDHGRTLYTSDRGGANQIWLLDETKHETRPLTDRDTAMPAVSPDHTLVAYADHAAGGIQVIPLAGGKPTRLTEDLSDCEPQWSRDGAQVLFQRTGPEGSRIWTVPSKGGDCKPITPPGSVSPIASPTSDLVVFLRPTDKGKLVMATDLGGSAPRLLFPYLPAGEYAVPRFSPDGKHLLLIRKMVEVIELDLDKNPTPQVRWKAGTEGIEWVGYDPDGDGLIAAVAIWDGDLWLAEGEFR